MKIISRYRIFRLEDKIQDANVSAAIKERLSLAFNWDFWDSFTTQVKRVYFNWER